MISLQRQLFQHASPKNKNILLPDYNAIIIAKEGNNCSQTFSGQGYILLFICKMSHFWTRVHFTPYLQMSSSVFLPQISSIQSYSLHQIFMRFYFSSCGIVCAFLPVIFFKILFLFIFKDREGEREGGKHQCVVASLAPPTGDLACNPGTCCDWESNQ